MTANLVPSARALRILFISVVVATWASTAEAQWWQNGIAWNAWPSGSSVGDCFGNCGAGCSGNVNPCGGPPRYWELQFLAGPHRVEDSYYEACNEIGELWGYTHEMYQAIGRWTFHGHVMTGCISHDATCNQWILGCALYFGCGSVVGSDTWSYDEWMQGSVFVSANQVGLCER